MSKNRKIKVVTLGGGTGQPVLLKALRDIPHLEITAIVNMFDNGGSNGRLCHELNVLPSADVFRCLTALSPNPEIDKFMRLRFDEGTCLRGHTLGNLLMTQIDELCSDYLEAVNDLGKLFQVKGRVLPVTTAKACLLAEYGDGRIIMGEHNIEEPGKLNNSRLERLYIEPQVRALPEVSKALAAADYIIASPGDLYTSLLANAVVGDVPVAIRDSQAKFIFVANLMTKYGQTSDMKASDLVQEVAKYCLRRPDIVLINNTKIKEEVLKKYWQSGEKEIKDDLQIDNIEIIRTDLLDQEEIKPVNGDLLKRSLIKHSSIKLQNILTKLLQ